MALLLVCRNSKLTSDSLEADPAELLPQLLDGLIALGDIARRLNHALGGNGHKPEPVRELIQKMVREK